MKTIAFKACYKEKRVTNSSRDEARENRAQDVKAVHPIVCIMIGSG